MAWCGRLRRKDRLKPQAWDEEAEGQHIGGLRSMLREKREDKVPPQCSCRLGRLPSLQAAWRTSARRRGVALADGLPEQAKVLRHVS